jgi:16S rRNA (cytosine1402-N4)-methyltransferase
MAELSHPSAMVAEVLEHLKVRSGGVYIDSTAGFGGHAEAILEASGPDGAVIAADMDRSALRVCRERLARFGERVKFAQSRFSQVDRLPARFGVLEVSGVLADLGPSRPQLLSAARGMSFASDARLDMRYDRRQELTAWDVVNRFPRDRLAAALGLSGKRREAGRLADAIIVHRASRAIESPSQLAALIHQVLGRPRRGQADASTEFLMSLRMLVNRDLEEAEEGVRAAARALAPGGRLAILSWDGATHRAVREAIRGLEGHCTCQPDLPCTCGREAVLRLLTRRGLEASDGEERRANPAVRTCRLFAAEKASPP